MRLLMMTHVRMIGCMTLQGDDYVLPQLKSKNRFAGIFLMETVSYDLKRSHIRPKRQGSYRSSNTSLVGNQSARPANLRVSLLPNSMGEENNL